MPLPVLGPHEWRSTVICLRLPHSTYVILIYILNMVKTLFVKPPHVALVQSGHNVKLAVKASCQIWPTSADAWLIPT